MRLSIGFTRQPKTIRLSRRPDGRDVAASSDRPTTELSVYCVALKESMPTETPNAGIVYGLTTPSYAGLVKIGRTSGTAQTRADQLYTTGVLHPFEVGVAYRVPNTIEVENALHLAFAPYRETSRREFFRVEVYQVAAVLSLLGTDARSEDVTEAAVADPVLIPNENIRRRRPNADFHVMGIPTGAQIVCRRNGATAHIAGPQKVFFEGEVISLSKATERIMLSASYGNAYLLWEFQGEVLMRIYDRAYPRASG